MASTFSSSFPMVISKSSSAVDEAETATKQQSSSSSSALARARQLVAPEPQATGYGEMEFTEFWEDHAQLLHDAWVELWEQSTETENSINNREQRQQAASSLPLLSTTNLVAPNIREAVEAARKDPNNASNEQKVRDLWTPIIPNRVYQCQLFHDMVAIKQLRQHLDAASDAGIPTRRPNGMNRYGIVIHPSDGETVHGAVHLSDTLFQDFYHDLLDDYVRPMGRLLFPDAVGPGDDVESYAFTVRYKHGQDVELNEHSDASVVTLNINLNIPSDGEYLGSTLVFPSIADDGGSSTNVTFAPGMAVLHLGQTRHAALPIDSDGQRVNLVVWLHGQDGYVRIAPYEKHEQLTPRQRWSSEEPSRRTQQEQRRLMDEL